MNLENEILSIANQKIQNFLDNLLKDLKNEYMNRHSQYLHSNTLRGNSFQESNNESISRIIPQNHLNNQTCCFILLTGNRKGEPCNVLLKPNQSFCKRHSSIHRQDSIERQQTRRPSIYSDSENEQEELSNDYISPESILIRKNEFNNFVYKNTNLIFKGPREKYIVAKEGLNGEWIPLTQEDKQLCKKVYKLRYKELVLTKKPSFDNEFIRNQIKLPYEYISSENDEKWISNSKLQSNESNEVSSSDEIEVDLSDLQL